MKVMLPKRQAGVALLEVLIAVVVVAVGLLGLAGLQGYVMRNTNNSYYRTIATMSAQDMADRIRANNLKGGASGPYATAAMSAPGSAADPGCIATGCTETQLAAYDFWRWNKELQALLPKGQGIICRDTSANDGTSPTDSQCDGQGNFLVLKVWWDDRKDASNLQLFATVVQP